MKNEDKILALDILSVAGTSGLFEAAVVKAANALLLSALTPPKLVAEEISLKKQPREWHGFKEGERVTDGFSEWTVGGNYSLRPHSESVPILWDNLLRGLDSREDAIRYTAIRRVKPKPYKPVCYDFITHDDFNGVFLVMEILAYPYAAITALCVDASRPRNNPEGLAKGRQGSTSSFAQLDKITKVSVTFA